ETGWRLRQPTRSRWLPDPRARPVRPGAYKRRFRPRRSRSLEELHRVAKQAQPVALGGQSLTGPARVLRRQDVPLPGRHQAQPAAADVAQAGDIALRAVRVDRVRPGVALGVHIMQHDLPSLLQSLEDPRLAGEEIALAVGHGQVQPLDAFEEGTT